MEDISDWQAAQLFPAEFDGFRAKILKSALEVYGKYPQISAAMDRDLDRHALAKKRERLADRRFVEARTEALPGLELAPQPDPEPSLEVGRPRTPTVAVYIFLVLRGCAASVSGLREWESLVDSATLRARLFSLGATMPGLSTIKELLNAISTSTRELILRCQLAHGCDLGLDDMSTHIVDSTAVASASAWPNEAALIEGLLGRARRLGDGLAFLGLTPFRAWHFARWEHELHSLAFALAMQLGRPRANQVKQRRERRRAFKAFLEKAETFALRLELERDEHAGEVENTMLPPSRRRLLDGLWAAMGEALEQCRALREYVAGRELGADPKLARTEEEEVYSLSDQSAGFIVKGSRETVFGYRVQIGRTGNGLISSLEVPLGNAADAPRLIAMIEAHAANTGIAPRVVSADDGYSSAENYRLAREELGVEVLALKGAKGKRLIPEAEWDSAANREARRIRSAVESTIFVGKYMFDMKRCSRTGRVAVEQEMLEKSIAHNFWKMGQLKHTLDAPAKARNRKRYQERAQAA